MNNHIVRIVAFLLVPCLMGDPTLAAGFQSSWHISAQTTAGGFFNCQAVVPDIAGAIFARRAGHSHDVVHHLLTDAPLNDDPFVRLLQRWSQDRQGQISLRDEKGETFELRYRRDFTLFNERHRFTIYSKGQNIGHIHLLLLSKSKLAVISAGFSDAHLGSPALFVTEEFQSRGFGRTLLGFAMRLAPLRGARAFRAVGVSTENFNFYQHLGFQKLEHQHLLARLVSALSPKSSHWAQDLYDESDFEFNLHAITNWRDLPEIKIGGGNKIPSLRDNSPISSTDQARSSKLAQMLRMPLLIAAVGLGVAASALAPSIPSIPTQLSTISAGQMDLFGITMILGNLILKPFFWPAGDGGGLSIPLSPFFDRHDRPARGGKFTAEAQRLYELLLTMDRFAYVRYIDRDAVLKVLEDALANKITWRSANPRLWTKILRMRLVPDVSLDVTGKLVDPNLSRARVGTIEKSMLLTLDRHLKLIRVQRELTDHPTPSTLIEEAAQSFEFSGETRRNLGFSDIRTVGELVTRIQMKTLPLTMLGLSGVLDIQKAIRDHDLLEFSAIPSENPLDRIGIHDRRLALPDRALQALIRLPVADTVFTVKQLEDLVSGELLIGKGIGVKTAPKIREHIFALRQALKIAPGITTVRRLQPRLNPKEVQRVVKPSLSNLDARRRIKKQLSHSFTQSGLSHYMTLHNITASWRKYRPLKPLRAILFILVPASFVAWALAHLISGPAHSGIIPAGLSAALGLSIPIAPSLAPINSGGSGGIAFAGFGILMMIQQLGNPRTHFSREALQAA